MQICSNSFCVCGWLWWTLLSIHEPSVVDGNSGHWSSFNLLNEFTKQKKNDAPQSEQSWLWSCTKVFTVEWRNSPWLTLGSTVFYSLSWSMSKEELGFISAGTAQNVGMVYCKLLAAVFSSFCPLPVHNQFSLRKCVKHQKWNLEQGCVFSVYRISEVLGKSKTVLSCYTFQGKFHSMWNEGTVPQDYLV